MRHKKTRIDQGREVAPLDLTGQIIAYESGELNEDATVALFQGLVDTGLAWSLQGHYGRTAAAMIDAGLVRAVPHGRAT